MIEIAETRSEEPDPGDRRHGALESADGELVRRRARAPPAGTGSALALAADLDRAAPLRVGPDDRAAGAVGNQKQAADQVSISNSIGSLRFLGAMDWRDFVETMSVVEQTLREDPRRRLRPDGLRHARPLPARGRSRSRSAATSPKSRVARKAIELAQEARGRQAAPTIAAAHVGYYLIGRGARATRARVRARASACRQRCGRVARRVAAAALPGRDRADHAAS